jgi:Flp pilus assembly protein TadD
VIRATAVQVFSRRELLAGFFGLPALTCLTPFALRGAEEHQVHNPPYLALAKFIAPGFDEFPEEKAAMEIRESLHQALRNSALPLAQDAQGFSPEPQSWHAIAPDVQSAVYNASDRAIQNGWRKWVASLGRVRRAEFYPLPERLVRFEVANERDGKLFYHVGIWKLQWSEGKLVEFLPVQEDVASAPEPFFRDVTAQAFAGAPSFAQQLAKGIPYWRSRLDPAVGIDIYGSNGIAVGDIDNDGIDEIYVCQPGGLPNRLYKPDPEGSLSDITEKWDVGLLDETSCALFLDLRNVGRQDLVVLRGSGPVLYLNDGKTFTLRKDAFQFRENPRGSFTGMAAADFDRDGRLDLYLCCYVYFQSEAQYTYASPYHDAQNGPPNFLFRNRLKEDGTGSLEDCTAETGLNENNDRFSFAPAWCDFNGDGWPDLYVANDFGRKNFYVNREGRFRDLAKPAGVEDIGPGMSTSWFDYDGDGRPDLYVANMWSDAGQRVIRSKKFTPAQSPVGHEAYGRHTRGNSLYHNRGDGTFEDVTLREHVQFGRWAWASGGHDLDNDGQAEILVTCGMLTNTSPQDLMSFFWRQVVAHSPSDAGRSAAYENGWNALNQFAREEYSWNGHEPNVLHVRRGNRYFDFSGVSGLDFAEDSRAFAVTDFDGDGRPDIILKSRLGPQIRLLQNNCSKARYSIAFSLVGTKSNRDAIGARVEVDGRAKWLEAGSGFLSQHSKRLLFGLGEQRIARRVIVTWPAGNKQEWHNLTAGSIYPLKEGVTDTQGHPFRPVRNWGSVPVQADNTLQLQDTWFWEPVPLPEPQRGPGLLVLTDGQPVDWPADVTAGFVDLSKSPPNRRRHYEIFRRYLFDWRAPLVTPLALLLNPNGHAVKVYGQVPAPSVLTADLTRQNTPSAGTIALPFSGVYIRSPKRDFFKFGGAFLWSGYPNQALPYLLEVLRRTPENARVLVLVGQIYLDNEKLPEAESHFRRALEQDAQSPEANNGLGLALAKQGRLTEARRLFEQAIAGRRDYGDAINNLGALYMQEGKINDAIAAFEYGVRSAPDDDILYLNLGRVYARLGQFDRARAVMQNLLDRKPDNSTARHALQELDNR